LRIYKDQLDKLRGQDLPGVSVSEKSLLKIPKKSGAKKLLYLIGKEEGRLTLNKTHLLLRKHIA
jgi:hypothetical protein